MLFIYFIILKGAAHHSQKKRSGKDSERGDEGKWNAHRWMLAVFSLFKGHAVLLGTVLVSHPLIVPWPLACHPFEAAFTHPLSFSTGLWPRTARHVCACWLGLAVCVVSTFIFQPWIFFFKWSTFHCLSVHPLSVVFMCSGSLPLNVYDDQRGVMLCSWLSPPFSLQLSFVFPTSTEPSHQLQTDCRLCVMCGYHWSNRLFQVTRILWTNWYLLCCVALCALKNESFTEQLHQTSSATIPASWISFMDRRLITL